jgi:hypothetical protein
MPLANGLVSTMSQILYLYFEVRWDKCYKNIIPKLQLTILASSTNHDFPEIQIYVSQFVFIKGSALKPYQPLKHTVALQISIISLLLYTVILFQLLFAGTHTSKLVNCIVRHTAKTEYESTSKYDFWKKK